MEKVALIKPEGFIAILDYNNDKNTMGASCTCRYAVNFYKAFLQWRKDAGMDNEIADHLADMFKETGFKNVTVSDCAELNKRIKILRRI